METPVPRLESDHSCVFCERKFSTNMDLEKHYDNEHKKVMFRCVACTDIVSLFPTYKEAKEHSEKEHRVCLEIAAQSSIFLPEKLVRFRCILCKSDEPKNQFLTEEVAKNHLGEHSKFFMKKPHKYLECVCRVCEGSGSDTLAGSEEKEVELHFAVHHPMENFASEEDVAEVVADNRECYEERSKWDSSMDSDDNQINQEEEKEEAVKEEELVNVNNNGAEKLTEDLKSTIESVTEESKEKSLQQYVFIENVDKNDKQENGNIEKSKEITDGNEFAKSDSDVKQIVNTVEGEKFIKPEEVLEPKVHFSVTFNKEKMEKSSSSPENNAANFTDVLVPLPYVSFPRQIMAIRCSVCPRRDTTYANTDEFQWHRESDEHRLNYGKCFEENKYQHFPDCAFFLNVSPRPICSWCGDIFSNLPLLFKHLRGHKLQERTDDEKQKQNYCETCQTQIMSSQHENNHRKSIAKTKTVPCIFCSKRVFRFYLDRHTSAAHHNQLFRCKIGECSVARSRGTPFANMIMVHQDKVHQQRLSNVLKPDTCRFPDNLVKGLMLQHIEVSHHSRMSSRLDLVEYICRVCNWREDTLEDVQEHARKHRGQDPVWSSDYRRWEHNLNRFRSDPQYRPSSPPRKKIKK